MGWTFMSDRPATADAYFREQFGDRYAVLGSATVDLCEYYAAIRAAGGAEVSCFVAMIRWQRDAFGYKDMDERMGPVIANCPERILDLLTPLPDCDHPEQYCRLCTAEITGPDDGRWLRRLSPGGNPACAGPRCYSGYPVSARRDDGPPFHEPGGIASCTACWARDWRRRCRENAARRAQQRRLLVNGATVRLVGAERYQLPAHVIADPTFTVMRTGRRLTFRHQVYGLYSFSRQAQWEGPAETSGVAS
jgi:hypothetical protein